MSARIDGMFGARATKRQLCELLADTRRRTVDLVDDLDADQLMGPELDIVNPPLWEIGHLAWFHERWTLRHLDDAEPEREDADELYDSIAIGHDRRWDLPLPDYEETRAYMRDVRRAMEERLEEGPAPKRDTYLYRYTTLHEDMHAEAFTYTRQTLEYAAPTFTTPEVGREALEFEAGALDGDVEIPGGTFVLGTPDDVAFAFDNERDAHEVDVEPFEISRAPVTNREFRAFVEAGGYEERAYWSDEGWAWRRRAGETSPRYWLRRDGDWYRRLFDDVVPLRPHAPVVHVNWWEARAWCRWAGRRLPTEVEWEVAAAGRCDGAGNLANEKRRFPWGDSGNWTGRAHLDGLPVIKGVEGHDGSGDLRDLADVAAYPDGDSAFGCRQMVGNVWEWTASAFEPYPGFEPDMYEDYSKPWFGDRRVLRGGAWASRARMVHNMFRNFFPPDRRDVFAGFRTSPDS